MASKIKFEFSNKKLNHEVLLKELLSSDYCHDMDGLTSHEIIDTFKLNSRPVSRKKINDLLYVWKKRKKCETTKKNDKISYFIIGHNDKTKKSDSISSIVKKIKNKDEKKFINEAIECLSVGSGRSTVIMIWCAALYKIYRKIQKKGFKKFNKEYRKKYPDKKKYKTIRKIDDFEYYPDSEVLIIAEELGIFDRTQRRILEEDCLKLRNMCSHPGKYAPKKHKINSFIEDVLETLF